MKIGSMLCLLLGGVFAQTESTPAAPERKLQDEAFAKRTAPSESGYILGPGDQITVRVVNLEEINDKPIPVELNGEVRLPMVGRVRVSGLTVAEVETELTRRLKIYLLRPDVSVSIAEYRSQPVSVIGAVRTPGVQQVQGRKTLVEMLSLAGGVDTTAGTRLKITRRLEWGRIPLPTAADDPTGQFSIGAVSLKSILEAKNPEENILVKPNDVISVPRAEMVYVMGQVQKPGSFILNDHDDVTVLQAVSMAGGFDRTARPQDSKILRRVPGASAKTEIAVNVKKILAGKATDVAMQPDDILFVPNNVAKNAGLRTLEAVIQAGTVAVWRIP